MKPQELSKRLFTLPKNSNYNIIILTQNGLRHKRFALRIQKEFPNLVVAWYQYDRTVESIYRKDIENNIKNNNNDSNKLIKIISYFYKNVVVLIKNPKSVKNIYYKLKDYLILKKYYKDYDIIELETFDYELKLLKKYAVVENQKINPNDVNRSEFCKILRNHNAYFLISLGGPLLSDKVINSVNGLALNQHAGHSPNYRGSGTIEWSLYHRDIKSLSNTVHLTTAGADSGPIVRRSNICIHPDDKPQKLFFKSVALGTELMIEVINEIIEKDDILVFDQPKSTGTTYLRRDLTKDILLSIIKDFRNGWLKNAVRRPW